MSEVSAVQAHVRVSQRGEFGSLPSETATAMAMVLTEVLQNALEHGFARRGADEPGQIVVTARRMSGRLSLVVEDDGQGLPVDFADSASSSLGLSIVRTLVESELKGEFEIGPKATRGTRVQVDVPLA